jgi:hypothetical protein
MKRPEQLSPLAALIFLGYFDHFTIHFNCLLFLYLIKYQITPQLNYNNENTILKIQKNTPSIKFNFFCFQ